MGLVLTAGKLAFYCWLNCWRSQPFALAIGLDQSGLRSRHGQTGRNWSSFPMYLRLS